MKVDFDVVFDVLKFFGGGVLGAIVPVILTPLFKNYYGKRREIAHIKESLKRYVSNMNHPLVVPFSYGCETQKNAVKIYNLSVIFSKFERSLEIHRFDKTVMLNEKDYKDILEYCYKQDISHFGLDSHEKIYIDLFFKKDYDFI